MTEKEVILLGFEKQIETSDPDQHYHYYVYDICPGLSLITQASDELMVDDGWYVEFFNTEVPIRYTNFEETQSLLNNLDKHRI